jgi:hypothetical protein
MIYPRGYAERRLGGNTVESVPANRFTVSVPPVAIVSAEIGRRLFQRLLAKHPPRIDGSPGKQITNFKSERFGNFLWSFDGKQLGFVRGHTDSDVVLLQESKP